ncbi:MAG TPA: hypothetical protein VHV30_14145 [Polyangiaceae bacterium]|nr:hypothetical protein [Polyangiaceae bacterium]
MIQTASQPSPRIELAPGAEDNGLAVMLGDLVRQNLEAKPHKMADFKGLTGRVAIVAEDAEVALTLVFERDPAKWDRTILTIHDGIAGIPDVTIRGPSEAIIALSNIPLGAPLGLPFPGVAAWKAWKWWDRKAMWGDPGWKTLAELYELMHAEKLHFYGSFMHLGLAMKLTRVMSVNG